MNKLVEELKNTGVFYIATVDGDQPRVRPFSSVTEFEDQLYICTSNTKQFYAQIQKNPKIEICGMKADGSWIRIAGKAIRDDRDEARAAMLKDPTGPSKIYSVGDGIFEVLRIEDAVGTKQNLGSAPEKI